MWRRGGATGEPCDAPPVVDDMAQREGYRSLETHGLICVERGLADLPAALGTTLHLQLGINLIQLPRNKIETLHSFGRTPQIGCRSLVQLVELRLPGNALQFLPEDIGLLQQLVGKDVDTLPSWVRKLQPDPSVLPSEDPNDRHKQKTPAQIAYELFPYNWEHTDDMSLYENAAYDTFEQDFVTEETSAQTRRVARNMRSLEKTGKVDDASFDPNEVHEV